MESVSLSSPSVPRPQIILQRRSSFWGKAPPWTTSRVLICGFVVFPGHSGAFFHPSPSRQPASQRGWALCLGPQDTGQEDSPGASRGAVVECFHICRSLGGTIAQTGLVGDA